EDRVAELRGEIATLEGEIDARRKDIAAVEADLSETVRVRQRLEAVERGGVPAPAPPPLGSPFAPSAHAAPPLPGMRPKSSPRPGSATPSSSTEAASSEGAANKDRADKDKDRDEPHTTGSF